MVWERKDSPETVKYTSCPLERVPMSSSSWLDSDLDIATRRLLFFFFGEAKREKRTVINLGRGFSFQREGGSDECAIRLVHIFHMALIDRKSTPRVIYYGNNEKKKKVGSEHTGFLSRWRRTVKGGPFWFFLLSDAPCLDFQYGNQSTSSFHRLL